MKLKVFANMMRLPGTGVNAPLFGHMIFQDEEPLFPQSPYNAALEADIGSETPSAALEAALEGAPDTAALEGALEGDIGSEIPSVAEIPSAALSVAEIPSAALEGALEGGITAEKGYGDSSQGERSIIYYPSCEDPDHVGEENLHDYESLNAYIERTKPRRGSRIRKPVDRLSLSGKRPKK